MTLFRGPPVEKLTQLESNHILKSGVLKHVLIVQLAEGELKKLLVGLEDNDANRCFDAVAKDFSGVP